LPESGIAGSGILRSEVSHLRFLGELLALPSVDLWIADNHRTATGTAKLGSSGPGSNEDQRG
jgi:hypothetical protein